MRITTGMLILNIVLLLAVCAVFGYLIFLVIKALRKYIRSEPIRKEKIVRAKTLGEVLKKHRTEGKMTQEFVAETLGVSRQAVSKWENGTADPSTSNLLALSRLFRISAEELLKSVNEETKREDRMEEGSGDGK